MSETATDDPTPEDVVPPVPELRAIATPDDLEAVDIEAPIRELRLADPHEMFTPYQRAFAAALEAKTEPAQVVYRLLAALCGIVLQPSDRGSPWGPMMTFETGRSAIPEDFRGEQTVAISTIAGKVENPGLRARLADIAWSNNRKDGRSATFAVDAYCDIVIGLLDGSLKTSHGRAEVQEAITFLHRAMQVAKDSTARNKRPLKVAQIFEAMHTAARDAKDIWTFVSIIDLGLDYGLRQPAAAAQELEALAGTIPHGTYPMAVKRAWDLAARLYHNSNDRDGRQRCLKAAVHQTLAMREEVKGSAGAEAGWVMDALQQLRHIEGEEKLEYDLEIELRRLQKAQSKQMRSFPTDLHLDGVPEKIAEQFSTLELSAALKQFAILGRSPDPEKMREEALTTRTETPFMSMISVGHLDGEGRTESRSAGAPASGEPEEAWFRRIYDQVEGPRRARLVRGFVNPARLAIQTKYGIAERHFNAIVGMSVLIPESQKPIVALGFTRLFQGDMMSATHLLIPQIEPCLRHVLRINGHDPSKRRDDGTEEDLALGPLLTTFRAQLDQILTPRVVFEIDLLFNAKPGPEVRHELAHGQIGAGGCFSDVVYYANWFMFHLCCLFILQDWDQLVDPQLAEDA
jgi:hypothetical protein